MSDNSSGIDFLVGFAVGALAGATLALLLAPQSGDETRQQLRDRSIELKGRAEELSARGRIVLEERVAQLEEAVAEGKKAAEKTKAQMVSKLEQARAPHPAEATES